MRAGPPRHAASNHPLKSRLHLWRHARSSSPSRKVASRAERHLRSLLSHLLGVVVEVVNDNQLPRHSLVLWQPPANATKEVPTRSASWSCLAAIMREISGRRNEDKERPYQEPLHREKNLDRLHVRSSVRFVIIVRQFERAGWQRRASNWAHIADALLLLEWRHENGYLRKPDGRRRATRMARKNHQILVRFRRPVRAHKTVAGLFATVASPCCQCNDVHLLVKLHRPLPDGLPCPSVLFPSSRLLRPYNCRHLGWPTHLPLPTFHFPPAGKGYALQLQPSKKPVCFFDGMYFRN